MGKRLDSHLHVWAPQELAEKFPYFPGQEPTIKGSAEFLLECFKEAGVDGALIVQPINHKFDHSYVSHVIKTYPGRFVGACLADPTEGGGGAAELERLVKEEGYRAVRFNPYLWPNNAPMTDPVGRAMFAKAGELGIPVGFMCFKGLGLHIADIEALCTEFPATTVLMDHFGFCKGTEGEEWKQLLGLARFPQVYVKLSAFFRVSAEAFPYRDTAEQVKQLVDTFGAKRLMWGSDFPFVVEECGYPNAANTLAELGVLSAEDQEWVMGKTLASLFPGGWDSDEQL